MKVTVEEEDGQVYLNLHYSKVFCDTVKIKNLKKDIPKIIKALNDYWRKEVDNG